MKFLKEDDQILYNLYLEGRYSDNDPQYIVIMGQASETSGFHRHGDDEDERAENPLKYITDKPIYRIDISVLENLLMNNDNLDLSQCKLALFMSHSLLHYHRRTTKLAMYVKLPPNTFDEDYINSLYEDFDPDGDEFPSVEPREENIEHYKKHKNYAEYPLTLPFNLKQLERLYVDFVKFQKIEDTKKPDDVKDNEDSEQYWNRKISNAMMMHKHNTRQYDGD
jgi:hypothetical protein